MATTLGFKDASQNIGTTAVTVLPARNNGRQYLLIQSLHATAVLHVRITTAGTAAAAGVAGNIKLCPGAALIFEDDFIPSGIVSVISDTASTPVTILEG